MRLATTFFLPLLVAAAGFLSTATATLHRTAKTLNRHGLPRIHAAPQPQIARRQYHPRRDLLDICISLDASVISDLLEILEPLGLDLHLCLCLNDLDIFLDTDVRATILSDLLGGRDKLAAVLKVLINDKNIGKHCDFPPHSKKACVPNNPCAFTCNPPYVKVGDTCVCQAPLVECNGQCGSVACGSAVPRFPKRAHGADEALVTTLAEAQAHCKSHETVCGIAGSEDTNEFECIDTRVALDSCGGCVTPHPFAEPPAATGVDCGRLPGVIGARCSQSKCAVSRCAGSWRPSDDRSECVNDSVPPGLAVNPGPEVGSLRMRRERRREEPLGDQASTNADVVVNSDSELLSQLQVLVDLVLQLRASVPASSGGSNSSPSIDFVKLVDDIIAATVNLLRSPTVESTDSLLRTCTLLKDLLSSCGCVDALGLGPLGHYLDKVIDAALAIQQRSGHNLTTVPVPQPAVSGPAPSPTPKLNNDATVIGLDDILGSLGLSGVKSNIAVGGLGTGLNKPLNDLLNGLGIGPSNVRARAATDAPDVDTKLYAVVDGNLLSLIEVLVELVINLKTLNSALPASTDNGSSTALPLPAPGSGLAPPVDRNLINAIVQSTADLLEADDVASLIDSLNALINTNAIVASTLGDCGCVDDLGLGDLVKYLDKVVASTLGLKDWCADHPVVVGRIPSGSGSPSRQSNILGVPINLGLDNLLTALRVDLDVVTDVDLQGLVNSLVQLVVNLQTDSTSLPASPSSTSLSGSSSDPSNDGDSVQDPVNELVQATGYLVQSLTNADLLARVNVLLDLSTSLGVDLDDLGLDKLVKQVDDIVNTALGVKSWCGNHGNATSGVRGGSPNSGSTPIILNAQPLLKSLGLDNLLEVDGAIGGLGDLLTKPTNSLLHSLGLGGVKRWLWQ